MRPYKNIKSLLKNTSQFSYYTFCSGRMYHKSKGGINFKLSPELEDHLNELFCEFLGLNCIKPNYDGISERLIICKHSEKVRYIAGQDYPGEIRYLKKLLRC
jgi:hypothetical protein